MIQRSADERMQRLLAVLEEPRQQLIEHSVYPAIRTLGQLRLFMEHHVFAVWDFMTLLKVLQVQLTSVEVPWLPKGDPVCRRLINEIVLGEESDEAPGGAYASHFELYRQAMVQCGADTAAVDSVLARIAQGDSILKALVAAEAPRVAAEFVMSTWRTVVSHQPHAVAAAFTFGREEVIPDMFRQLVADLNAGFAGQLDLMQYYLRRHIELDQDHHAPLAKRMLSQLCGDDDQKWREATDAAVRAVKARIALWDGILDRLEDVSAPRERSSSSAALDRR